MNDCEFCTKDIIEIPYLELFVKTDPYPHRVIRNNQRILMWTAAAPYYSGSMRILVSFIEACCFIIQSLIYKKRTHSTK